jgi:ubiquinone/menaquinone biosynthesis C-methylase UbiE
VNQGRELWEQNAGWWQEGFTEGADVEYVEQILPWISAQLRGSTRVLDVGCGEGQVGRRARRLRSVSFVAGIDPTFAQLQVARRRRGGVVFGRAEAAALPFSDRSFDAAVACLVFEHIEDVDTAVAEVSRVLAPYERRVVALPLPVNRPPSAGCCPPASGRR